MTAADPIDLRHLGDERVIGSYLLETDDGPAIFDCGPASAIDALKAGLAARGLGLRDVRHLLLSHIHLDHAGAAGLLVREHPQLQVHVSPIGAPHLVDPTRLERSARRLYGDAFDTLWGELAPVPEENVHVVGDRVLSLDCFPSPGHASHQWYATIDEIERRAPARLALVHFGVAEDVNRHLDDLRRRLAAWAELVGRGATETDFTHAALADVEHAEDYDRAMPLWQSYEGLARWAAKRKETAA